MSNASTRILRRQCGAGLLLAAVLPSGAAGAQLSLKRQKYDSIATRNKGEHAVYTEVSHTIAITEEDGELVAASSGVLEELLISDKSLNAAFNTEHIGSDPYFSPVTGISTIAYIPQGYDYKTVNNTDKHGDPSTTYTGMARNSITRTGYTQWHRELHLLQPFYFSKAVPVLSAVFEVKAPKNVKIGFLLKGADTSMIKRTVEEKAGIITYRFTGTAIPADKYYSNVPSGNYYVPHVVPYIVSFRLTGAKKDSVLGGSVDAHYKYEYRYVKGLNLRTDSILNKKTAEVTRGATTDREKVGRIYNWVQNNFHYISRDYGLDGLVPRQADTVCKRMYGDCKDMSSILMAMCRRAGVPAYFAAIGSNNKPYTHEELQSERTYDHMICAVQLDGEWVFLDGTTHVLPLGANRIDLQGKEAMILMDDHRHQVVKIPEAPAAKNVTTDNTTMNIAYNDVTGTATQHYSGYGAWDIAEALALTNRKEDKDRFVRAQVARGNNKFLVSSYDIAADNTGNKDVTINAAYTLGGYVQQVKKEYFVDMNVKRTMTELRVNDDARNVPVYLDHKKMVKETVTLNIPKGARVTYLPKAAKGGVDGLWSYNITYKTDPKNHTVTLVKEYELNTMKISPDQFAAHNRLIDELKNQYKETVVLTAK